MGCTIGIDLGTTNTCVAALDDDVSPYALRMADGATTMPSVVALRPGKESLVGATARRQAVTNPKATLHSVKRFIGRRFRSQDVQDARALVAYDIGEGPDGFCRIEAAGKSYRPDEISALVLKKVKELAEEQLGQPVTDAVIAVPAYFTDPQRQATREAGKLAGLNVRRLINEPTAAALAYGIDASEGEKMIAVFDLGGGTFDISILRVLRGTMRVLATAGDANLGGDHFDERLVQRFAQEITQATAADVQQDPVVLQRLREAAETAKIALSAQPTTPVALPFLLNTKTGPYHYQRQVSREEFDAITGDFLERLRAPCDRGLQDAKLTAVELDDVLLVGGMSQCPSVLRWVEEFFGRAPSRVLNPAEVVALGAAIQSGVLDGEIENLLLLDVTPHTLGIRVKGGFVSPLIARNSSVPCQQSKTFVTTEDNQNLVLIDVVQGESNRADACASLGRFELSNIPPGAKGTVAVEVTFGINSDGIVSVTAREKVTGKSASVRLSVAPTRGE